MQLKSIFAPLALLILATRAGASDALRSRQSIPTIPTTLPGAWTSKGCFTDSAGQRILALSSYTDNVGMTVESCIAFCQAGGYPYAGVEFSQECYCDYGIEKPFQDVTPSNCNMPCTGNSSELCGGSARINIFHNFAGAPDPKRGVTPWNYISCWQDLKNGEISPPLPFAFIVPNVTNAKCVQTCSDNGYNYAGTEFAHECWCGNQVLSGAPEMADTFCQMTCLGQVGEQCGGYDHLSMWKRPGAPGFP